MSGGRQRYRGVLPFVQLAHEIGVIVERRSDIVDVDGRFMYRFAVVEA